MRYPARCPPAGKSRWRPGGGRLAELARTRRGTTALEFAICGMALVGIVIGSAEFGRLVWTSEVLQEAASEGARCMGLRANSCAAAGVYSAGNTTSYVVGVATARGVTITAAMVALNNAANCGGAAGFSQVLITYQFATVAPALLASLAGGLSLPRSACFPNSN
jgi:hypothetical protein